MTSHVINILKDFYDIETIFDNDPQAILARIWYVQNLEEQMRDTW